MEARDAAGDASRPGAAPLISARPPDGGRRWAVLLLPAALVGLGLLARAAAGRAFAAFTGYATPFAFSVVPQLPLPPLSERVVFVLTDGLGLAASRRMPFLNELRAGGASFECRTGLPSLSMPARAVLMTGAWQEIHGQVTNYDPRPLAIVHLFQIARVHGRTTALAAGARTQTLFSPYVQHAAAYGEQPETAPLARYEEGQRRDLAAAAALLEKARPHFSVVELNLADDAGHGWGASSPEYARAAAEVDDGLRALAAQIDLRRDTMVVTADHGHVASGGHGGPEPDVMQVPLVMAGAGVRRGATGTCAQVDVAPTLAALLGLPMPPASQGAPLVAALDANPVVRSGVLRNAITQREHFVLQYAMRLYAMDAGQPRPGGLPAAGYDAEPAHLGEDEAALSSRLAALAADEARIKATRSARESARRRWRAAALVGLALAALVAVSRSGGGPLALLFGLLGVAAYHLLLPVAGLSYSLTAVNKDEWLRPFFMKDMVLGVTACTAAAAALGLRQRRRGADLLALCRHVWLCATVFCSVFVLKLAFVYARQEVVPRWFLADQYWGMTFYLDALVVMAVGLFAPALALIAGLVRLLPPARGRLAAAAA
jgi:hypothetical protein